MYTQQQAQSLWCPLRCVSGTPVPPVLPIPPTPTALPSSLAPSEGPFACSSTCLPTCLGETCALWRWRAVQTCDPDQNCTEYCHTCPSRRGYCGYGGTPETV